MLLREAQRASEAAVAAVLPAIVPGVREVELAGRVLAAMAGRGLTACHVEPIFCVIPRRARDAPWTFPGGLPYRELTGDAMAAVARAHGGDPTPDDVARLGGSVADWPAFPDSHDALTRLQTRFRVGVEDLLLLARIDQTRAVERTPVDLSVLAADACSDAVAAAPGRP